jgi:hypothetical protein
MGVYINSALTGLSLLLGVYIVVVVVVYIDMLLGLYCLYCLARCARSALRWIYRHISLKWQNQESSYDWAKYCFRKG